MGDSYRSNPRHEVKSGDILDVEIRRRAVSSKNGESHCDSDKNEIVKGELVDISPNGIKIRSRCSFSFHESIVLDIQRPKGGDPIHVAGEVRWTQPDRNIEETWSTGCVLAEQFPVEFINEIASIGILDRRKSARATIEVTADSRVETAPKNIPIVISDVSAYGLGIVCKEKIDIDSRMQIEINSNTERNSDKLTVRVVRHQEVSGGSLYGCKVLKGSTYRLLQQAVSIEESLSNVKKNLFRSVSFASLVVVLLLAIRQAFLG